MIKFDFQSLNKLRKEYFLKELTESGVSSNPFDQFEIWFKEILKSDLKEPNAMIVATSTKDGIPSVRTVLLKEFDESGFVFYTNYKSEKGKELLENPNAALLFYWGFLERQIRITGTVEKVSREKSAEYFHSRPRESQIGAWASNQSQIIEGRDYLQNKFREIKSEFEEKEIPLPEYWGGFKVVPEKFEFWQGRESRLHDRICYLKENNTWKIVRLAP